MPQIFAHLSEDEVKEIDNLVGFGVFNNREEAINISVKLLVKQDEIKKADLIRGMAEVNDFLMDNIGDLPFATSPLVVSHNGKKLYKFPVKTRLDWDRNVLLGFICLDAETFEIVEELSASAEKLNKVCDSIAGSIENTVS